MPLKKKANQSLWIQPYMEDDPDLVAGASVVATQLAPHAGAETANTPWGQSPQGTLDDMLVTLAVTGLPAALIWATESVNLRRAAQRLTYCP